MILFAGYRNWALEAFRIVDNSIDIVINPNELEEYLSKNKEIKIIFFVGWSWIVPNGIVKNYKCLCFHPSDLPNYKGGSPIQHQVLDGLKRTRATLFLMNEEIDAGPIFKKSAISLEGKLSEIFKSLTKSSSVLIKKYIDDSQSKKRINFTKQDPKDGFTKKRRKPSDSEITIKELKNLKGEEILRKILVLDDPYPNAYFKTIDGKKLIIKKAILE